MLRKYITRILYPLGECFGGRTILKKLYALRREAALPFEERKKQAASRLYQQVVEAVKFRITVIFFRKNTFIQNG